MMGGQFDVTNQFPGAVISRPRAARCWTVTEAKPNFPAAILRFQDDAAEWSPTKRVREAHEESPIKPPRCKAISCS